MNHSARRSSFPLSAFFNLLIKIRAAKASKMPIRVLKVRISSRNTTAKSTGTKSERREEDPARESP